jgi:hypothetical protein
MTTQLLNLPINIPWKQVAVSPDMMDTRFGNKRFPFAWRSSLAIAAYEPRTEELPPELCDERITYLKITCSITGYQPSEQETKAGLASFSDLPEEERARILRVLEEESYFACYGVLLNVAVFPLPRPFPGHAFGLEDYPHVIALEPRTRDLYQAATETGEILTSSQSAVKTDKTLAHTESTETGFEIEVPITDKSGSKIGGIKGSRNGTDTDQATWSVQTDASRERRETQGTTTQLSQMYNLLAGYHQGTNRAAFLMLPRPHTLQPTDRRTFIQGLREIEGIQEFMLIVSRPARTPGLCVEAFLETGHFPEDVRVIEPTEQYRTWQIDRTVSAFADNSWVSQNCEKIEDDESATIIVTDPGWVIDLSKGDPGHPGVAELQDESNEQARQTLDRYNYQAISETTVKVTGTICGERGQGDKARFKRSYRVFLRSVEPISSPVQPHVPVEGMLIVSRGLQVCMRSGEQCPEVVQPPVGPTAPIDEGVFVESIVHEPRIKLPPAVLTPEAIGASRMPAVKELLRQIQKTLAGGSRLPSRYPADAVGFLDTEYFKKRVIPALPRERLEAPLVSVKGLPDPVIKALGEGTTVSQALEMDLATFAQKTGLEMSEAARARRALLGITTPGDREAPYGQAAPA